jgi:hypothetical protein
MWLMSITASNPAVAGRVAGAACRPAQPVMAGATRPLPSPPSIVRREIIPASVDEAWPKRNRRARRDVDTAGTVTDAEALLLP